ncbi:hypothetical protein RFI_34675, partial [Reticulomyxa filosa]
FFCFSLNNNIIFQYLFVILIHNYNLTQATVFMFDTFRSSSKLLKIFTRHIDCVNSIDYSTFDDNQFICSGSCDAVRIWDYDNNKQIHHHQNVITIRFWDFKYNQQLQLFNEHTDSVIDIEFLQFNGGRYLCSGHGTKQY